MIDHLKSWPSRRSISFHDQNPESPRTVTGPLAPARRRLTDALPRRFRGPWNGWMKRQVRERLLAFFEEHEIEPPSDLLVSQESLRSPAELRSYIAKCIALMSDEELRELRIPAEVAMRAHQ